MTVSINDDGYKIIRNLIPEIVCKQFRLWALDNKNAHRGNAVDGNYYDEHDGKREYEVWWTKSPPREMWLPIIDLIRDDVSMIFGNSDWSIHCVDTISTRPKSSKVWAHIDMPYKFEQFNKIKHTLGVQVIIPLDTFTLENGATAFLPGSHKQMFDWKDLEDNRQKYNDIILSQGIQFISNPGDVLMYDGRTLHSTMPNNSTEFRSALLINLIKTDIIPELRLVDPNTDFIKT